MVAVIELKALYSRNLVAATKKHIQESYMKHPRLKHNVGKKKQKH